MIPNLVCSLLAYAGHICAMGLEVAGSGRVGKLTDSEAQQAADTVLAALPLGHVLLALGGSAPRYPKPTKEFLARLAAGEGTTSQILASSVVKRSLRPLGLCLPCLASMLT